MSTLYSKGFRSVYSLTAHIVFVTKYRKKLINQALLARLNEIFVATCHKWGCELLEFNGEVDHVHLLIRYHPQIELSKFIANLKTVSSRLIRKDFTVYLANYYRSDARPSGSPTPQAHQDKPVFWTGSYFVASCGGVTVEQLKIYVEQQSSPNPSC